MNDRSAEPPGHPSERVRVTGPQRRRTPTSRARATQEIDAGTAIGAVYMASLLREQRQLAVRVVGVLALVTGALPLAFHLRPQLGEVAVAGVPIAWILLAIGIHPLLLLLGWWYVRRAEANERDFADLLGEVERDEEDR